MYQNMRLGVQIYGLILSAVLLMTGIWTFNLLLIAAALGTALFAGRLYCGWICPMGFWTERVLEKITRGHPLPALFKNVYFRYLFLAGFISFLVVLRRSEVVPQQYFPFVMMGLVFVLATMLGFFYQNKSWCSHLCPWGILGSLLGRMGYHKLAITGDCAGCRACERACLIDDILPEAVDRKQESGTSVPILDTRCIRCHSCVEACPNQAFGYVTPGEREPIERGPAERM